jgi:hypothetical protein
MKNELTISETEYLLSNGKEGKLAVFMYAGISDPSIVLDQAIAQYTNGQKNYELISSSLDNPWMRVIMSNIDDIKQSEFNPDIHRLNS